MSLRFFDTILLLQLVVAAQAHAETFESFTEPSRTIDVAPAETGVVARVEVREGDRVRKGQVLASLDKEVLLIAREIAQASVDATGRKDAARAEAELRKTRLDKIRTLRSSGHAASEETQRAEMEHTAAKGQHQSLEEQAIVDRLEVRKIDSMIERRLVRSPIDGIVTHIHYDHGEFVTPIAPTIVTVVQLDPLRAVFNLPQSAARALKPDATVVLNFPEEEEGVPGKVEFIAPVIDADSGTVRVKVLIDNIDQTRLAGRRCTLRLDEVPAQQPTAPQIANP
ncbi:MAG: efflux RND transporter periplasmic adaptor subunit [Planctomycetia bacterium]|nr:efflux RND transporter periplasmic adaptor subunit [Planctomycetia bacterium]